MRNERGWGLKAVYVQTGQGCPSQSEKIDYAFHNPARLHGGGGPGLEAFCVMKQKVVKLFNAHMPPRQRGLPVSSYSAALCIFFASKETLHLNRSLAFQYAFT